MATKFVVTIAWVAPAVVVVVFVVSLCALATTRMALVAAKVALVSTKVALVAARVFHDVARVLGNFLEKYLECSQIGSRHIHQARWMDQVEHKV